MLDRDETDIAEEGFLYLIKLDFIRELHLKGIRQLVNNCNEHLNKIKGPELLHLRGTSINLDGALQLGNTFELNKIAYIR